MEPDLSGRARPANRRSSILSVPAVTATANSYQRLLYEQLWHQGIELVPESPFTVGWLRAHRGPETIVHVHWPYMSYGEAIDSRGIRGTWQTWRGVMRFGMRLAVARALGYRVVWTVHEVLPPDVRGVAHRVAAAWLARASSTLIVHDDPTLEAARRLPTARHKLALLPHPSYVGVYPRRRTAAEARRELELEGARFVFLYFGLLRPYKGIDLLLEAFASTRGELPDVMLVIAGQSLDPGLSARVNRAAEQDSRIKPILRFIPDHDVAELFDAADACVYPRGDGGTTGTVLLSLSLDTPVIAARTPAYLELLGEDRAGWLFTPDDAASLRQALLSAADAGVAAVRAMRASERIAGRDWGEFGRRTAQLLASD